jgi:O-antigen/teichoic acid export membrane protein
MSQTRNFIFDAGSNCLRMAATILGTVFLTRAMALRWGVDAFGRWSLITTVMSLALLLDLGLSNIVLKAAGKGRGEDVSGVLSSAFVVLLLLSGVAGLVLAGTMDWTLPGLDSTLKVAVFLLSMRATVATLPWTVCRSALYARGKMFPTNVMQSVGILIYSAVASIVVYRGASLAWVAALSLAFTIVDSACLVLLLCRYVPDITLRARFDYASMKPMLSLGGASLLVNLAGFILLKTDPIIVKSFLPFAQVAVYAVALRIAENIYLLCKQLVNALTPHAIRAGSVDDPHHRARLFERASRYVMAFGAPIYVCAVILGEQGIRLWLSPDYAGSAVILNILLLAMILSVPQLVGSNLLTFSGDHKKTATLVVLGACINVAASVYFVHVTGATGVAYGTLFTTLAVDVALAVPFACRKFHVELVPFAWNLVRSIVVPCSLQAGALIFLGRHLQAGSLGGVILQAIAGCSVFVVSFIALGVTREERRVLLTALLPNSSQLRSFAEVQ